METISVNTKTSPICIFHQGTFTQDQRPSYLTYFWKNDGQDLGDISLYSENFCGGRPFCCSIDHNNLQTKMSFLL